MTRNDLPSRRVLRCLLRSRARYADRPELGCFVALTVSVPVEVTGELPGLFVGELLASERMGQPVPTAPARPLRSPGDDVAGETHERRIVEFQSLGELVEHLR